MTHRLRNAALIVAGALTLSLAAGPAMAATPKPAIVITPTQLTIQQYSTSGLTAKLTGFTPGDSVDVGWGGGERGDMIGEYTINTSGAATVRFQPRDQAGVGDYTFTARYGATAADGSRSFVRVPYSVKLGSNVTWRPATRTGDTVKLSAKATRWSESGKKQVAWKNVVVKFQEKVKGTWKTVAKDRTNAKGVATVKLEKGKHTWRALLSDTPLVWGDTTAAHKK
jgi:hypothetical protein